MNPPLRSRWALYCVLDYKITPYLKKVTATNGYDKYSAVWLSKWSFMISWSELSSTSFQWIDNSINCGCTNYVDRLQTKTTQC